MSSTEITSFIVASSGVYSVARGVGGTEKFKNVHVVLLKQRRWLIETQTGTLASSLSM